MYLQLNLLGDPDPLKSSKAEAIRRLNQNPRLKKLRSGQKSALAEYLREGLDIRRVAYDGSTYSIELYGRSTFKQTPQKEFDIGNPIWWESVTRWVSIIAYKQGQRILICSDTTYKDYPSCSINN